MDLQKVMAQLKASGTAQNRKVYGRHGVRGPCFGVSYANQGKLAKRIGKDRDLARELWKTGNHDARVLATMIAEPERTTATELDRWVRDLDNYVLTDALSSLAAISPTAPARMRKWMASRKEFIAAAGWNILTMRAGDPNFVNEEEARGFLAEIESGIHDRPNRVRHSMNSALIALGVSSPVLHKRALAAAKKIGKVVVDHGQTSCKTPDAASYMAKVLKHRKSKSE